MALSNSFDVVSAKDVIWISPILSFVSFAYTVSTGMVSLVMVTSTLPTPWRLRCSFTSVPFFPLIRETA